MFPYSPVWLPEPKPAAPVASSLVFYSCGLSAPLLNRLGFLQFPCSTARAPTDSPSPLMKGAEGRRGYCAADAAGNSPGQRRQLHSTPLWPRRVTDDSLYGVDSASALNPVAAVSKKSKGTWTGSGRPEGRSVPHTMALFHTPSKEREREQGPWWGGARRLRVRAVGCCQDRFTQINGSVKQDQ